MCASASNGKVSEREPWIAATLSWLLPGAGHLYAGDCLRGFLFLGFALLLHTIWVVCLVSASLPLFCAFLAFGCSAILLPATAALFAFKGMKRRNSKAFDEERRLTKDPWLAMFLSLVLPGAGHAYLRHGGFAVLYAAVFVGLYIYSCFRVYAVVFVVVFFLIVCVHANASGQIYRHTQKRALFRLALFIVLARSFGNLVLPEVHSRFVFLDSFPVGTSMEPTLREGDLTIVDKVTYRLRCPEVGEIVLFKAPQVGLSDVSTGIGKRVVAVGGETVHVDRGRVIVNGEAREFGVSERNETLSQNELPITYYGQQENPYLAFGVHEPYCVPQGHYFVLGDNRLHSVDSRAFGAVPQESIIGRVVRIYWPYERIEVVHKHAGGALTCEVQHGGS